MNRSVGLAAILLATVSCGTKIDAVQDRDVGPLDLPAAGVTWCNDIQPLMARFCASCHDSAKSGAARQGAPAGADFDTYATTAPSATAAKGFMQKGAMPPSGRIPDVDLGLFLEWIDTGMRDCGAVVSEDTPVDVPDVPAVDNAWTPTCTSGRHWTQADGEGFQMSPGGNCITCHSTKYESPSYMIAGTVMGALHDETDCNGVQDVLVVIEGADKVIRTKTTNAAGNFWFDTGEWSIALPYKAHLSGTGTPRYMTTAQTDLNCANCHTVAGANGAPGRVVAP
jgi:mono/diheme cytochrome c family protein